MQITASMVKELREKTGAGMMDAKKALQENNGDFEASIDWLRKKGVAKAAKKSARTAAEGMVWATAEGTKGAMVEVNAETDFVAKNEKFTDFVKKLSQLVLETGETDIEKLSAMDWPEGGTVGEQLTTLIATIGENMSLRRASTLSVDSGAVQAYIHMNGKIGVLVGIESSDSSDELSETARQVAMHVAASNPQYPDRNSVDAAAIEREKAVYSDQAKQSGKPENIIEKIVEGRMNKFFEEVCLVDQAFIMDTDRKVGQVISGAGSDAKLAGYVRFQLGEGIERKEEDFAAEVAAAVAS